MRWGHVVVTIAAGLSLAGEVHAQGVTSVFSASGPGQGKGAFGLGAGVFYFRGVDAVGPSVSIDYGHGIGQLVDFNMHFDMGTLFREGGVVAVGFFDPGLIIRVAPRSPQFSAGIRLAPELIFAAGGGNGDSAGQVIFGAVPGVLVSFGSTELQVTLGADFPLQFATAGSLGSGSGFGASIRPSFALEAAAGSLTIYVRVAPQIRLTDQVAFYLLEGQVGLVF